jgi:hypothetical protein
LNVKIRGILGAVFMLIAVALTAWVTVATLGLATFQFRMEMSIAEILVQFLPVLSGLSALALLVGIVLFFVGKADASWKLGGGGFLLALPIALFVGVFGIMGATELAAIFGASLGSDPPMGRVLGALLLGVPGLAVGATLFAGLGAFLVSSSVVKESEQTFDRNPTRGMNIMDPSVQKELEEARKKHQEKQNQ